MKISYVASHGVGEWVDFDPSSSDTLTIVIDPRRDGVLVLDGSLHKVKFGEVTLALSTIPDGEHRPRLECESGVITLQPFRKGGRCITPTDDSRELTRRLAARTHELEQRLEKAEKTLAELNNICRGHKIFNYERKEK